LLRDLTEVGTILVRCEHEDLPGIEQLDPEGAYFSWLIRVETDKGEDASPPGVSSSPSGIARSRVTAGADEAAFAAAKSASGEDQPMAPVPFDLSLLDGEPASRKPRQRTASPTSRRFPPAPAIAADAPAELKLRQSRRRRLFRPRRPRLRRPSLPRAAKAITPPRRRRRKATVAAVPAAPQTIRVDLDRVDRLINLVGELVINQAMLAQSVVENESGGASAINLGLEELQQLTREIQDSVMAIRAQPVKPVFQRMGRIVREIADMTGKHVRLVTEGENTEVDKTVIDKLAEPLDPHDPQRGRPRARNPGKTHGYRARTAEGVCCALSAKHRSGRIVIEIADDGAGINRERVRNKAIENGLITADTNSERRGNRQPDFPSRLLDRGETVRHLRARRRDGRGQTLDPVNWAAGSRSPPSRDTAPCSP
jgi:two-component system chemotaxis sensor kinase CheA